MEALQMVLILLQPHALRLSRFLFFVGILLSCLAFHCNEACDVFSCGDYSLDFPFGLFGSGCGDPKLQVKCDNATKMPLITIGGYQYYIREPHIFSPAAVVPDSYPTMMILFKQFEQDACNFSDSVYDQFWSAKQFHIVDGYANITLSTFCTGSYGEPYSPNLMCNEHKYYNDSLPGSNIVCESDFRIAVNETDLKLGKRLPQITGEGINITWYASKDCEDCETDSRNCTHLISSSFCYCDAMSYSQCSSGKSSKNAIILGSSIGGGVALAAAVLVLFLFFRVKRRKQFATRDLPNDFRKHKGNDMEGGQQRHMIGNLPIFSFEELQQATDFFDEKNELGDGGFGAVYLGKLIDGRMVAVKKLYQQNSRRIDQFVNEVEIFANMNHPNLVRLYGCTEPNSPVLLLVYEFLPNGTLADHLHGSRKRPNGLPWGVRLNIAIDTAQALAYLHSINPPVFHRDVKSTNILLDEYFRAKVADFGLSRLVPVDVSHVTTAPQGTPGYVDPEYHECFQLTEKSDVYSFGVVLVELISAKLAVDVTRKRNEISLAIMAVNKIKIGALQELVDPDLGIEANPEVKDMVSAVAELAFNCLANNRDIRPDMREVTSRLEQIKELHIKYLQEQPHSFSKQSIKSNGVALPPSPTSVQERWPSITSDKSP
ncbi:LEAF RUST 10 DISEASE-RESISTANCE LOCUS RECEPTOR-LIKE PROTEIN KINASE-like 1.2 [Cryptomeria japonica]|uniref:LEAF RUST 10 DISEASE-RESISTANCE LOCUS RECEPTOR-LIKE PROTEIN KINASE-like 1.2 n=1 Tax=Cryptomeria japonica TaxID=3369 RepID=UPI0027D9EF2A|nr:LEAF RUST 10 DISEASE-RESISTANCE LOCUS RECEPTOR-LIKE PROTEIN KINASE-like 1.2 [Cryptomeria japonica]